MINYKSIRQVLEGQFSDKNSSFYSFLHPINNLEMHKEIIKKYKEQNPNACHVCSAYRIYLNGWTDEYGSDDGEPAGSAGLPMLNILKRNNLINIGAYVIRIYGGINLGIPGLINAYSTSIKKAIDDKNILFDWEPIVKIFIQYSYNLDKIVNSVIKSMDATIINQRFKEDVISEIAIKEDEKERFLDLLNEKTSAKISILK